MDDAHRRGPISPAFDMLLSVLISGLLKWASQLPSTSDLQSLRRPIPLLYTAPAARKPRAGWSGGAISRPTKATLTAR